MVNVMEIDPATIDDTEKDGSRLTCVVTLFGGDHHLTMIRVRDVPCDFEGNPVRSERSRRYHETVQRGVTDANEEDMDALQRLYEGRYETVKVPGYDGEYVCYMHPFEG